MQTNVSVTADPAVETNMKKRNTLTIGDQLKSYAKHPGAGVLAFLTLLGAVITFALLFFLIGYVLVKGIPYLNASLFSFTYTSENVSLLPSLINTLIMTLVSLAIAAPVGIFAAIFLVEYAKKGSRFVKLIRITAETLSGIPSIVYGYFGLGSPGTTDPSAVRRNRKQYAGSMYPSGNHDPSDDHRSYGIGSTKRSGKLL